MRKLKPLLMVLALCVMPACAAITLVEAEQREITDGFTLHPQIEWSRWELEHIALWTVHGPQVESLRIARGLEDGDPLLKSLSRDVEMPSFRSDMSATEVAELVDDTLQRAGAANVEVSGLEPSLFGGHDGFRFGITMTAESGLRYAGLAVGTVYDGRLYMLVFTAPELHYFNAYADTINAMIESARIETEE